MSEVRMRDVGLSEVRESEGLKAVKIDEQRKRYVIEARMSEESDVCHHLIAQRYALKDASLPKFPCAAEAYDSHLLFIQTWEGMRSCSSLQKYPYLL